MWTLAGLSGAGLGGILRGDGQAQVRGVRRDSRTVTAGDAFVAIGGFEKDGADFVPDALRRGASAIISKRALDTSAPQLVVPNARVALSLAAELVYGRPTSELKVAGITGTNGKTTTTYLLEAIVHAAHASPAVMGTVSFRAGDDAFDVPHTTAEGDDIARFCRAWSDGGVTHLAMEVSSHALELHRVDGIDFDVAAFTNLTRDHLDFHGTFDEYAAAKERFFTELSPRTSVINIDDDFGRNLVRRASHVMRTSCHTDAADIFPRAHELTKAGTRATVETPDGLIELESPLVGMHNLANLLTAIGCGLGMGIPLTAIAKGLQGCTGAPGRLQRVPHPGDVGIYVDYAHTPDALENVLRCLRAMKPKRLIVVFGCGGDRDPGKRAPMGRAASEGADVCILTSDNPRSEDAQAIAEEAMAGMHGDYICDLDRRSAITTAIRGARPGDIVLIAGKGHEVTQEIGGRMYAFDDRVVAAEAVSECTQQ